MTRLLNNATPADGATPLSGRSARGRRMRRTVPRCRAVCSSPASTSTAHRPLSNSTRRSSAGGRRCGPPPSATGRRGSHRRGSHPPGWPAALRPSPPSARPPVAGVGPCPHRRTRASGHPDKIARSLVAGWLSGAQRLRPRHQRPVRLGALPPPRLAHIAPHPRPSTGRVAGSGRRRRRARSPARGACRWGRRRPASAGRWCAAAGSAGYGRGGRAGGLAGPALGDGVDGRAGPPLAGGDLGQRGGTVGVAGGELMSARFAHLEDGGGFGAGDEFGQGRARRARRRSCPRGRPRRPPAGWWAAGRLGRRSGCGRRRPAGRRRGRRRRR